MTEVDFEQISSYQRYKLMASLIVPRPIALVTSLGTNGVVNAAPFSMFNMVGEDPPIVMLSINRLSDGRLKDTAANILASGEFVVHMTDEAMAQQMHACGEALPADMSELTHVGFTAIPSHSVKPPRILEAPVAFECVLHEKLETDSRYVFIGRVVWMAARDGLIDTEAWRVNLRHYHPVARFGASFYNTTRDRFAIEDGPNPIDAL
jgi:flavin reductase (DIM6/NTAB) family NADH-FMN oxidoreductase RutF